MSKTRTVAYLGMGIALYVVLGMMVKIPLIGHIQTDLGYIAFGAFLYIFGWQALVVGAIGCLIESLIVSGWIPAGWIVGQILIGLICGYVYVKSEKKWLQILTTIISVFIGIAIIKTGIECLLYGIPLVVKFPKNTIAFVADTIPMLVGLFIGKRLKNIVR